MKNAAPWISAGVLLLGLAMRGGVDLPPIPFVNQAGPLGKLVAASDRPKLAQLYRDLSAAVTIQGMIDTTGEFRRAQIAAAKFCQTAGKIGTAHRINQPINKILIDAVGVDGKVPNVPLTAEMRRDLSRALSNIAGKF
tara:strand:+ start:4520 stop:4933 length:414 start_codon:yes stop_codon:yes gene_type:complete